MSDDEIGSAPNDASKAPMDPSTKLAVAEGLTFIQGVANIAGGSAEVLFDPSAGVAAVNDGAERIAIASNFVARSANDASQAALAEERAREHELDPPQASMQEITKDEARRNDEYTKEVEETRRALGETPEPHADPHVQRTPIPVDEVPPIFD